jgi:pimeloyl-ACP methyl ester carboxylesterase/acyl carrier protein
MGEVAAAVVAGGLSLGDGVRVICRRSRLCVEHAEPGTGAMATVELGFEQVLSDIEGLPVDVAMIAAPSSTVIGGRAAEVRRLVDAWTARGVRARPIAVDFASHCALTALAAKELEAALPDLHPLRQELPFYTTVLPDPRSTPTWDASYWAANLRNPVRAMAAAAALAEDGFRLFQEISPHPVALNPFVATLESLGVQDACVLPTFRAGQDGRESLATALAALHCAGHPVPWQRWYGDGALADVPPTSWERRHHLIDLSSARPGAQQRQQASRNGDADVVEAAGLSATLSAPARRSLIEQHVTKHLRAVLRLRARRIDPAAGFADLGLDSLHAVQLRGRLQRSLEIPVPLAAIWAHPTIQALSTHLSQAHEKEQQFVTLPAGRFRYRQWGIDGRPPAVLLHANAGSAASWSRVGPALAEEFQVFALDLRGHGGSVTPPPGSYGLRAAADDVIAFLDTMGLRKPLLIGHSWGAAVALVLAGGAESGRAAPPLLGLVLEDPPPELSPTLQAEQLEALLGALALPEGELRESVAIVHPEWDTTDRESFVAGLRQANPVIAASLVEDGARSGPLLPLLARLTTPVLLLRADPQLDGVLSDADWSLACRLLLDGGTAVNLPGAAHEIHRSRFDEYLAAIRTFTSTCLGSHPCAPLLRADSPISTLS